MPRSRFFSTSRSAGAFLAAASLLQPFLALGAQTPAESVASPTMVPDNLAMSVLGTTNLKVITPASSSLGANGNVTVQSGLVAPGIAFELSPFDVGWGRGIGIDDYQANWLYRFFAGSNFSLAVTNSATATTSTAAGNHLAIALKSRLWNFDDWRLPGSRVYACIEELLADAGKNPLVDRHGNLIPLPTAKPKKTCELQWNPSQGALGVAATFLSPNGVVSQTGFERIAYWLGASQGFGDLFWVQGALRYTRYVQNVTPATSIAGGGVQLASRPFKGLIAAVEGGVGNQWLSGKQSLLGDYSGGVQVQIWNEHWIGLNYASEISTTGVTHAGTLSYSYTNTPPSAASPSAATHGG